MSAQTLVRLIAASLVCATTASCGISNQGAPVPIESASPKANTSTTPPSGAINAVPVTLYFVSSANRLEATRAGAVSDLVTVINHLLAGPTGRQTAAGVTSAIPSGTKLLASKVIGTLAALDFSDQLASVSGQEQVLAFAQIVTTATSLPDITSVQVSVGGKAVNAPLPDGTLAPGAVTQAQYASLMSR